MCLEIISGPHIAEKDISVIKIITLENKSEIRDYPYSPNTLSPKVTFGLTNHGYPYNGSQGRISAGYHSFPLDHLTYQIIYAEDGKPEVSLKIKDQHVWFLYPHVTKAVRFVIPKGATYYVGQMGLASDQIRSLSLKAVRLRDVAKRWKRK